MKVEVFETWDDKSEWRGLTDKARSIPFQLIDETGSIQINPEKLDRQLQGEGLIPNEAQIQTACILLGISPEILRGQLRFRIWELRGGQTITVIGTVTQGEVGLEIKKIQGETFVVSPLLGSLVDNTVSTQTKKARTWMLILGIPGIIFLLCGLTMALVSLIQLITSQ
jgi:hypothetical protein